jgi:hypothetical protein
MNERIQELVEQAGYKPLPGFNFANSLEETYLKKFAELIVRECMEVVTGYQHRIYGEGFDADDAIKEHFGVES